MKTEFQIREQIKRLNEIRRHIYYPGNLAEIAAQLEVLEAGMTRKDRAERLDVELGHFEQHAFDLALKTCRWLEGFDPQAPADVWDFY